MLFNTIQFAIFFLIVYLLYLILNHKLQNRMLLAASCIFYGAWDWRFLFLMFISITTDFFCAKYIHQLSDNRARKRLLIFNLIVNFGILGFFKYFNFFAKNLQELLYIFGFSIHLNFLHIILPVGISFYTFQAISYAFDVYRRQLVPTENFFDYALFVTYFPQLVAGPIERASHLLPQVLKPRKVTLDKFYEGCYLIFWGLFQKIFIADNLAKIADTVFVSSLPYNGANVLLGLYAFAFQIYCDFDGYSNIARGLGKCMGFDIIFNFKLPYFATNPSEFWRRWHISLSSWLKDYLYIPLGGSKKGTFKTYRNLAITMLLGGLWHGAAWTFILWGAYHGILLIIYRFIRPWLEKIPPPKSAFYKKMRFAFRVVFFFHLVCIGWLIFRAESFSQIFYMFKALFSSWSLESWAGLLKPYLRFVNCIWLLLLVQILQFTKNDLMAVYKSNTFLKTSFYIACYVLIILHGVASGETFIYFQF